MDAKLMIADINKPVSKFALGTSFYNVATKEQWFDVLDGYTESGGTIIDTARGYSTSEAVIGLWLDNRSVRDKVIIVTKCGLTSECVLPADDFDGVINRELAESLKTLRTDYIDLYMLHRDNQYMPVWEILEPLNKQISDGKVHAIAASNWEYRRVSEANEYAYKHGMKGFAAVSNNLSLAAPAAAFYTGLVAVDKMGEAWHRKTGIPLLSWASLARGFFSGQYTPRMRNEPVDGFTSRMIKVYCTDENFERLARANELGAKKGCTAVEVALSWLLNKPFNMVPIVGLHTRDDLASCLRAFFAMTEWESKWLNLEV